jgi:glycine oxidase
VNNVALMRALAVACRKAGVALHERTTVRRVLVRRGAVRGVETDRARYEAPRVVNCLGAWAPLGRAFPLPASAIVPARGQMLAFQGPRRVFRRPMMSDRGYLIQRADGRITLGSTVEIGVGERALTAEGMHAILSGLRSLTSALDACAFVDSWVGFRPYSQDGWPLLGATALEGLSLATGHFRHGILLAPVTAQLMADLILHRRSCLDLAPFSPARFNS